MSDKKMYDILGHFRNQNPELKKVEEAVKSEPVYEEVEARGSIMEAIKTLGEKFAMFKEAKAKPDFLDVDKDGNKKETFKKAVKDKEAKVEEGIEDRIAAAREKAAAAGKTLKDKETPKSNVRKVAGKSYGGSAQHEPDEFKSRKTAILDKDEVDEGQGPYELYNPKHPKFKANYEKYKAKNPGCKLADFIAAMKKREHGVSETSYSAKAARAGKDIGKPGKNFSKIAKGAAERYGSKAAGERVAGAVLKKLRHGEEMDEVITKKTSAGDIIKDFEKSKNPKFAGKSKEQRKKQALGAYYGMHPEKSNVKESKQTIKESRMMEGEYDYETVGRLLAKDRPGLDTNSSEFKEAVYAELKKMGIPAKHAQYLVRYDEDFLGDAATSYGYFCKHQEDEMSESAPMFDDHGAMQELDEIARLAGLPTQQDEDMMAGCGDVGGGMEESMMDETCPSCDTAPCSCVHEEEMEMEGNEFSGALAKAKAAGAKDFEVGGKRYTVKEDTTVSITSTLEDDVLATMRKLAGMVQDPTGLANSEISVPGPTPADLQAIETGPELEPVDAEAAPEVEVAEDGPNIVNAKPRKNSVLNTPREEYAASDITTKGGTGYDRNKKTYRGEWPGDNPMDAYGRDGTQVKEEALWKSYENMIETIKK